MTFLNMDKQILVSSVQFGWTLVSSFQEVNSIVQLKMQPSFQPSFETCLKFRFLNFLYNRTCNRVSIELSIDDPTDILVLQNATENQTQLHFRLHNWIDLLYNKIQLIREHFIKVQSLDWESRVEIDLKFYK